MCVNRFFRLLDRITYITSYLPYDDANVIMERWFTWEKRQSK